MITIQKPRLPPVLPFTSVERHIKHVTLALPQRGAHGFHKLDYGPWQLGDCYLSQADACWLLRVGSPKCVSLTYGGGGNYFEKYSIKRYGFLPYLYFL